MQYLLFIGLEWQPGDLILPGQEVFQFWASRITRNLDSPITDGTHVLVVILDLATSDFQAFSMVPEVISKEHMGIARLHLPFMTTFTLDHHASLHLSADAEDFPKSRILPAV